MTNPNKTSITVILDKSGSMSSVISDTIGGYNQFIKDQQKLDGECEISLIQFNETSKFIYKSLPIKDVVELTNATYRPSGNTALIDALGKAIDEKGSEFAVLSEDQRPSKVLFVIITDGEENSSKEYKIEQIKEKIKTQTDVYSWNFTFLGANMDAVSTAGSYGIAKGASLCFSTASAGGVKRAFTAASNYSKSVRSGRAASYSDADRQSNSI